MSRWWIDSGGRNGGEWGTCGVIGVHVSFYEPLCVKETCFMEDVLVIDVLVTENNIISFLSNCPK